MAASSNSFVDDLIWAFTDGPVAQELMVLVVFGLSFLTWRSWCGNHVRAKAKHKHIDTPPPHVSFDKVKISKNAPSPAAAQGQESLREAEHAMIKQLENREFTKALNMYRSLDREGRELRFSEEFYTAFILSATRVGKADVVDRMFFTMRRQGLLPSLRFWQSVMKLMSSRKIYNSCLNAFQLFGRHVPGDKVVFSCLINAALELDLPDRAAGMLERYQEAELNPKDYVLCFRVFVALEDADAAEALFRKLRSQTSALMFNLLLLICVKRKQPKRALDLIAEAHTIEIGQQERIVDTVSYNTVIKGFAQAADARMCYKCLQGLVENHLQPDDVTLSELFDICVSGNGGHDLALANEIGDMLISRGRLTDKVICTLFIKGMVRAGCLPKALELYGEMKKQADTFPDIVTYSVLIKALVDQHELEKALMLLEDMTTVGLSPDDIILTHLLEGCRHAAKHELGKRLIKEVLSLGVKPSDFTLVTMLKLHGRCGAHQEAFDLISSWQSTHGSKPSVIHYTCLMSGCVKSKAYPQAWSAYKLMRANGIEPDETTFMTLFPGMVAAHEWDHVLSLTKEALKGRMPLPTVALNNALSQMLASGSHAEAAQQLKALMAGADIAITSRNLKRFDE
jgi:pentatricopeptide repeat protein